ncbi:MAG: hypothetical protein JNL56_05015 [Alphaproteobacteria bacterium]|nr:hypothetical protein [Alphaproteobacteria bacterium]
MARKLENELVALRNLTAGLAAALMLASLSTTRAQDAAAPPAVPSAPPAEAVGPDAAAAKDWIQGEWTLTMTPPDGQEADAQSVNILFAPGGVLTIGFSDESDAETGTWLVTAATAASASILLDEKELDADPADDIYLDVEFQGRDAGKGILRSPTEGERLAISMTRGGAAPTPSAAPEPTPAASAEPTPGTTPEAAPAVPPAAPSAGPVTLSETVPASIAGAIEAVKTAGAPADARIESAAIDLNGDGTDEALVKITHMYWCSGGMDACRIWVLQSELSGGWDSLGYPYAKGVALLDTSTNGYRDLSFDGVTYVKGEYGGYERKE